MQTKTSIKKNYFYSLTAKIIALTVPLVVAPYVSRIIGADGTGVCSYIASLVSYFVLFANLGVESYALREIAMHRDDQNFIKKFVIEITILKAVLTACCLLIYYLLFIVILNQENKILYLIYSITLVAVALNFTWFFQGIERFNVLALSSIVSKLIFITLIFVLVKEKSDLSKYALIVVAMTLLEYAISIPFIFKFIKGKVDGKINPFKHIKGCMVYFLPTIAVEIYTVVDKTMIGLITQSDFENGYYEYAEKLVKVPLTVITAVSAIMQSRVSYYYANDKFEEVEKLSVKAANFSFMLSLPMACGMAGIAHTAIPIYLGEGYEKCIILIYVLVSLIPVIAISNLFGSIYYTPFGKRKTSAIFLAVGAVVNIALNSFMIYLWQSLGAAIASLVAESVISLLFVIFARKFFPVKTFLKCAYKYLIASVIMGVVVFLLNWYLPPTVWYLLMEIGVGIVLYAILLVILRAKFFTDNVKSIFNKLFRRKKDTSSKGEQLMEELTLREIQLAELEILKEFDRICRENNLKYSLSGGTLLGAIRHKGFIPWDDDIDVMMPRPDYEKLKKLILSGEVLNKEFSLVYSTTKGTPLPFLKLIDKRIEIVSATGDITDNLWIDIFPIDGFPSVNEKKFCKKLKKYRRIYIYNYADIKHGGFLKNAARKIFKVYAKMYGADKALNKINKLTLKHDYENSENVAVVSWGLYGISEKMPKEQFEENKVVSFEGLEFSAVASPHNYLSSIFGDYMQLPPEEKRQTHSFIAISKATKE